MQLFYNICYFKKKKLPQEEQLKKLNLRGSKNISSKYVRLIYYVNKMFVTYHFSTKVHIYTLPDFFSFAIQWF